MRDEWYVARRRQDGNKRYGPVSLRQLGELLDAGKVRGEDLVWREGMANWQRADQCDALTPPAPRPEPHRRPLDDRREDHGPGPAFDDRSFPRPAPRRRSSGTVVALIVGGAVLVVGFLVCGGVFLYLMFNARSAAFKYAATSPAVQPPDLGDELPYGDSELYYNPDRVSADDASAVGMYLSKIGYFPSDRSVLVQLDKDDAGTFQVRCCVTSSKVWDANVVNGFQNLRADIAKKVLYAPTDVQLCDETMQPLRTITASD